ncbi:MAG: hypothetical protein U5K69_05915 [Balneolaceae bacterium]|nr:hypothetical protein [Balneolaceae bacterium]
MTPGTCSSAPATRLDRNPQRGVFRSRDGGDTWENVLFASDSTGAIDLEFNPENPDEIYAAMWRAERKPWTIISGADKENGLYKSTNGGDSWTKLSGGLPEGLTGKIDLAVTPADPSRIYALVEAPGKQQGLYRSEDRGESWTQTSDTTGIMNRPFYFTNITAHPTDPNTVYVGNVRYWVSTDGGETFERRRVTHADVHDLWINPDTPQIQIQGNDGGATVTLDGGKTWSTQYNQPTAELYQVNPDDQFPYWLYAGQQDNTTIAVPSRPPAESAERAQGLWHTAGGCETGPAVPQTNNPSTIFANCKGRFGQYSTITGQERNYYVGAEYMYGRNPAKLEYRFQRVVPIEISPHDSSVVYNASQYVHKTTNGGQSWEQISPDLTAFKSEFQMASGQPITRDITGEEHYSTLYVVQVSPHSPDVIWTGANDGPVHITRDGGQNWTEITPEDVPPNGRVDGIDPSPHNPGTAYVAVQQALAGTIFIPISTKPVITGTHGPCSQTGKMEFPLIIPYGRSLRRSQPRRPALCRYRLCRALALSLDGGQQWQKLQQGLPLVTVTDIKIKEQDLIISTMGRGFWILDNLTPFYQFNSSLAVADRHLFNPRESYRMRYDSDDGDSEVPKFPEAGTMIDFYLKDLPAGKLTLDILDEEGTVVRRFVGTAAETSGSGQVTGDKNDMIKPEPNPFGKADSITIQPGHNRFNWNFRHPAHTVPSLDGETYFGANVGPMASPGSYKVRLSTDQWTETQDFTVKIDPRVQYIGITKADLEAQEKLNLNIRDAIGTAHRISAEIDTLRNRIRENEEIDPDLSAINNLYNRLVTSEEGSYQPPMLIDQLEYLYYMTTSADQRPGDDAYTRFETLRKELEEIQSEWERTQEIEELD